MNLLGPDTLLSTFALAGLQATVFVEAALLVGFLLPGDSLSSTAGIVAAQPHRPAAKRLGPEQLARAEAFFDEHEARTVVLTRFVPEVRTITRVMAGASGM